MAIITIVIITVLIMVLGGGIGYLIWLRTRPRKETWRAKIYNLSDGVKAPIVKDGKVISDLALNDLIPYCRDVIEKIDKDTGITIWRLQKLKKPVPPITADLVEVWEGYKEVSLLELEGSLVPLKKGYDNKTGKQIFTPIKVEDLNYLESRISEKQNHYKKEKDILEAISPFITTAIMGLVIVALCYGMMEGIAKVSEQNREGAAEIAKAMEKLGERLLDMEKVRAGIPLNNSMLDSSEISSKPPLLT